MDKFGEVRAKHMTPEGDSIPAPFKLKSLRAYLLYTKSAVSQVRPTYFALVLYLWRARLSSDFIAGGAKVNLPQNKVLYTFKIWYESSLALVSYGFCFKENLIKN